MKINTEVETPLGNGWFVEFRIVSGEPGCLVKFSNRVDIIAPKEVFTLDEVAQISPQTKR